MLVGMWLVLTLMLWNAFYDLVLGREIKEYLFRSALYDAGRGPRLPIAVVLDPGVFRAVWVSTIWACAVLLAGLITIRALRPQAAAGGERSE